MRRRQIYHQYFLFFGERESLGTTLRYALFLVLTVVMAAHRATALHRLPFFSAKKIGFDFCFKLKILPCIYIDKPEIGNWALIEKAPTGRQYGNPG